MAAAYTKTILITGGGSGIGLEAAKDLAKDASTRVVIANRSAPTAELPPNVEYRKLDLGDLASVDAFVKTWPHGQIDAVGFNAGIMPSGGVRHTPAGVETSFAINHLGHAALFFSLKNANLLKPDARIVFTSSDLHNDKNPAPLYPFWESADDVAHARSPKTQVDGTRYCNSKLANALFSLALARRVAESKDGKHHTWGVNTFDPGFVPGGGSQLARNQPFIMRALTDYVVPWFAFVFDWAGIETSTTARSGAGLAAMLESDKFAGKSGEYVRIDHVVDPSTQARDVKFQDELWDWTVAELALGPAEAAV